MIGLLLPMAAAVLTGCALPAFITNVVSPEKILAVHTLTPRTTLVIVDDPGRALGDPNLAAVVAANVGHHLTHNQAINEAQVVPQDRLTDLAGRLGDSYLTTPIDRVGKQLEAGQVIHVLIRSVSMQVTANYYRPTAVVEVKVIDADTGQRLFPAPGAYPSTTATSPGFALTTKMRHRTLDDSRRDAAALMARHLSERIGRDVAELFFDHPKPDPAAGD